MLSAVRPLARLTPELYPASLIIFGILQVQEHATIIIMQSEDLHSHHFSQGDKLLPLSLKEMQKTYFKSSSSI